MLKLLTVDLKTSAIQMTNYRIYWGGMSLPDRISQHISERGSKQWGGIAASGKPPCFPQES
jgi:hypothetical protein